VDIANGWFAHKIAELSKIDPSAQSFRYPMSLSGDPPLASDYFVNVKVWGETMDNIATVFFNLHMVEEAQRRNRARSP